MKKIIAYRLFLIIIIASYGVIMGCKSETTTSTKAVVTPDIAQTNIPVIDKLTQAIAVEPNNADLYAQRGAAFYEYDAYDEAIKDLTASLKIDSSNVMVYHVLADVYMDYFQSRLALKTMEKATTQFPERLPTLLKLSEFQMLLKKYPASLATVDKILKKDPTNAEAFFMMGVNFKEMQDTARAINSFQKAVDNEPDLTDAWINLGQLLSSKNLVLAEKYFDNAIRVDSNNIEALHAKAYYLANQRNDLDGALNLYHKINSVDPQYEDAYYNAGLLYLDKEEISKARTQFDILVKNAPTHIRAYYYRGLCSEWLGDKATAKTDYEQALRLAPNYEAAQKALARVQ